MEACLGSAKQTSVELIINERSNSWGVSKYCSPIVNVLGININTNTYRILYCFLIDIALNHYTERLPVTVTIYRLVMISIHLSKKFTLHMQMVTGSTDVIVTQLLCYLMPLLYCMQPFNLPCYLNFVPPCHVV